jgi:FMN phosphatase YigB (HAD superfamily)
MSETNKPVKLVVFDLGGVVFRHSFDLAVGFWAAKAGTEPPLVKAKFHHGEAYALHEVGAIGIDEYKIRTCAELGIDLGLDDFIAGWNAIFLEEIAGARQVVEAVGARYSVAALSNTNPTHCAVMQKKYGGVIGAFHKVFYSHEIAARKPDAGSYQRVMDEFGATAAETVFLDDLPENIAGAQRLGIRTVHVTGFEAMVKGLKALGVLP